MGSRTRTMRKREELLLSALFIKRMEKGRIKSILAVLDVFHVRTLIERINGLKEGTISKLSLLVNGQVTGSRINISVDHKQQEDSITADIEGGGVRGIIVNFTLCHHSIDEWIHNFLNPIVSGKPLIEVEKRFTSSGCPDLIIGTYARAL